MATSLAKLDYSLDIPSGRIISADCQVDLEAVADDPFSFALLVNAPFPEDLERARTVSLTVEGRRLFGTVRHIERLDDDSLKLQVEPD
ncbi:hypothetical protein ACIQVE_15805 [Pseudomonas sp. NPDC098747]|uniref:hypothetical protein n=1 Tax=Pseudomonas sp. NPDC098747 TaxID=3364487 RepID=UPI003839F10F